MKMGSVAASCHTRGVVSSLNFGGLVFKAHRLCISLNSRLVSNKEEEDDFSESGRNSAVDLVKRPIRGTKL